MPMAFDNPTQELDHLDTLWFQIAGTLCNLRCNHCFISGRCVSCYMNNRTGVCACPYRTARSFRRSAIADVMSNNASLIGQETVGTGAVAAHCRYASSSGKPFA